ncbi:hypothetical protein ABW20_dc0108298 [Dactylellina cionopaga]|nr:hypothetical protein ABW20_dc0108298 [Dactylellina cionopaga]
MTQQPPPTLQTLTLIPPILDCIVTYLHTIDLLQWSATSHPTRHCLFSSHAAWRAICFHNPERSFTRRRRGEDVATTIFDSMVAVRRHGSSSPSSPSGRAEEGDTSRIHNNRNGNSDHDDKTSRYLSVDTTLTILARLLPLAMYTSIDLSRTMADKHLLRDLVDHCRSLKYLVLEECPKVRVADLVVGLYGVEKRVLTREGQQQQQQQQQQRWRSGSINGGNTAAAITPISLVAETMGRRTADSIARENGGGGGMNNMALSRLTHVHTKEVRDGLYRMNELRDGVRGEIVRCMSRMEDVYAYPEMPDPLFSDGRGRKGVLELKEIRVCF